MLRRYRIKANDYEHVLKWVQEQPAILQDDEEDEKAAEVPDASLTMPHDWLPKITWAHKTKLKLQVQALGKHGIQVKDGDTWKRLVHEEHIDQYLRDTLLAPASDVPLSRDAGYHIVQKRTIGISRRAFGKFIAKQAVLQITRNKPAAHERKGTPML